MKLPKLNLKGRRQAQRDKKHRQRTRDEWSCKGKTQKTTEYNSQKEQ